MWALVRTAAVWIFGDDIIKYTLMAVGGCLVLAAVEASAATHAILAQAWGQWWLAGTMGGQQSGHTTVDSPGVGLSLPASSDLPAVADAPAPVTSGNVSDVQRFQLIEAAGAPPQVAIVMTALSIAEDGSGSPTAVGYNKPSYQPDYGLWQVNGAHVGSCGITSAQWLFDPMNNARAAMCILGPRLNYCAWSTFDAACGPGHTGTYRAFIAGATLIAQGQAWQH